MKPTLTATGRISATIAAAATLGILGGCLVAWLVFSAHLPARVPYAGFAPELAVLLVYSTIAVARLGHNESSFLKLLAAALCGLFLALLAGAVVFEMIGFHYDPYTCINLERRPANNRRGP